MANTDRFIDEIVTQCIFSMGAGAGMPIKRSALYRFKGFAFEQIMKGIRKEAGSDKLADWEAAWNRIKKEILGGYKMVGIHAQREAIDDASDTITDVQLRDAYNKVTQTRKSAGFRPTVCDDDYV